MNKKLIRILAGTALFLSLCAVPMTSFAATIDDAIAVARQYGIPEETIQAYANMYYESPELYPPERIDSLIEEFKEYAKGIITNVPYDPNAQIPTVTETTPVSAVDNPEPDSPNNDSGTVTADDSITLTMPDGSTFTRISAEKFINLSYEDKMTYLSTFTSEQQTVIINNLTPTEYKSLMKQLPMEDKLNVIDNLTGISDSVGLNITVDEITDNSLSFQMKNQDGELIGAASINDTIEATGYDRRGIIATAGALIMAGLGGMFVLIKKCFRKETNNE